MPIVSVDYIDRFLGGLKDKKILLLGISYRQDVGDTRYSPSEIFSREVIKRGGILSYQDPLVTNWAEMGISVCRDVPLFDDFDAVVFAVQHKEYANIDFSCIHTAKKLLIFDSNRVLSDAQIDAVNNNESLVFKSIGRGTEL